jgi:hypothetical protein
MSQDRFLAGLEEAVARIVSLLVSGLIVFAFWIGGDYFNEALTNPEFIIFIIAFWIVYEILSFAFFQLFRFFSQRPPVEAEESLEDSEADMLDETVIEEEAETDTEKKSKK